MKKAFKAAAEVLLVVVLLLAGGVGGASLIFNAPSYEGEPSDHFDGVRFHNDPDDLRSWADAWRWMRTRQRVDYPDQVEVTLAEAPAWKVEGDELRVYQVNHSTFLIQTAGVNILTDPMWSERAGPVSFAGPRRVAAAGVEFGDLPPIDVVLVSHNHYDHLDLPTLVSLHQRHEPVFVVPLGNAALLHRAGVGNTLEADWWDEVPLAEDLTVFCTPARHWSGRGPGDRNRTLWGSFVIRAGDSTIVFVGDSGYSATFGEIRERFGPVRLALLPMGAYEPRWFMEPSHMNPAEMVQAHVDLGARWTVGHHFGTFQLADDGIDQPLEDLQAAREEAGITADRVRSMVPGERFDVP
jgi:L-ascorbate metabolism protein UlaG (beta-lactamase superfamily)